MRQTTRLLQTVLIMGGLLILVLAASEVQSRTIQPSQPQNAVHLASIPLATPHTAQLSTYLPLVLDSYTVPVPPQPPFGEEPHAVVGNLYAPVVIFDFADFQCPFCKRHHDETLPQIYDHYIETGLVRYVVKDFPLSTIHPQAQKASEAAECAGAQGAYWQMHDRLYDEQAQWSGNPGAVDLFKQYARPLGLDGPAFDACLDEGVFSTEVLEDKQEGMTAGVRGTPTFFFFGPNGSASLLGAYPYDAFQQIIDSLLNGEKGMTLPAVQESVGLCTDPLRLKSY